MGKFLQEFKQFAMRGNVVDMAVGIIIGGAFGKIVSSVVGDIIMPAVGLLVGGVNFTDLKIVLKQAVMARRQIHFKYYGSNGMASERDCRHNQLREFYTGDFRLYHYRVRYLYDGKRDECPE